MDVILTSASHNPRKNYTDELGFLRKMSILHVWKPLTCQLIETASWAARRFPLAAVPSLQPQPDEDNQK
jgi:hypothetical protein